MASHSVRRFCSRRFSGLGFGLPVSVLFTGKGRAIFQPTTATGNGIRLNVVQETVQNCTRRWHVTQKLAPLLQEPVAGHDGGPISCRRMTTSKRCSPQFLILMAS